MAKPILLIRGISDRENAEQFSKAISNQFNGEYHILFVFDVDYKKHYISVIGDNNPILPKETKALLRKITTLDYKELEKFISEQEASGNIKT